MILSDNSVHPVSASDCIEKEGFEIKNLTLIENITSVDKEQCKQECLKVNFVAMGRPKKGGRESHTQIQYIYTFHYYIRSSPCRKIHAYGMHSNTTISMRLRMRKLTMATGQSSFKATFIPCKNQNHKLHFINPIGDGTHLASFFRIAHQTNW